MNEWMNEENELSTVLAYTFQNNLFLPLDVKNLYYFKEADKNFSVELENLKISSQMLSFALRSFEEENRSALMKAIYSSWQIGLFVFFGCTQWQKFKNSVQMKEVIICLPQVWGLACFCIIFKKWHWHISRHLQRLIDCNRKGTVNQETFRMAKKMKQYFFCYKWSGAKNKAVSFYIFKRVT